jgi:tRNA pseudouridine38-40 synthase
MEMCTNRFKLTIEYDGTAYAGWQRQADVPSVQETIETAIKAFTGNPTTLYVAGRTDAGVHATGQVAHVDIPTRLDPQTILRATNAHLSGHPIVITAVDPATSDFHARFDATKRFYTYKIINRPAPLTFDRLYAWHIPQPLNVQAMQEGANFLIGKHDFTTFRTVHCQSKSPIKTLDEIYIERNQSAINFHISAPSFLHHQVRNIVGTLALVGKGQWSADSVKKALEAKDRAAGGPTAPPHGLYLTKVIY